MWGQDQWGNFRPLNGGQLIKLNYESNQIKFTIYQTDGYIAAYVIGDFNNWHKAAQYQLEWGVDPNDGRLGLQKSFGLSKLLVPGQYKYSYVLIDIEGREILVSQQSNQFVAFTFQWEAIHHGLIIQASEDSITPGFALDLIAIKNLSANHCSIAKVNWSYTPYHTNIILNHDQLLVRTNGCELLEINLKCVEVASGLSAERVFKLNHSPRLGKLVHFIKNDQKYSGDNYTWDLWTYTKNHEPKALPLTKISDLGVSAITENHNVIARKKTWDMCWHNDWAEQTNAFELDYTYDNHYIVYGDNKIHTSLRDVIARTNPRINYAVMDDKYRIMVYLSHEPLLDTTFELYINGVNQTEVNIIVKDEKKQVILTNLPLDIIPSDLLEIRASNTFLPCKVTLRGFLDQFSYLETGLGILFTDSKISLCLWAPTAKKVELLIYSTWYSSPDQPEIIINLHLVALTGTHQVEINRQEFSNKFYLYRLYFDDLDKSGKLYTKITYAVDPYAYGLSINANKGVLVDLSAIELQPDGWINDSRPLLVHKEDAIIYEIHLRDFTVSETSGVSPKLRGKYLGSCAKGTRYTENNCTIATGLDSLLELGITHVHLLPFSDFSSVDEAYSDEPNNRNWGYDPQHYNVPEGSYATNPYDPLLRILETREMIHTFHKNGIRVIMDMVYNHMTSTKNLDNIVPGYYFRSDQQGHFSNGSGCGNELASERPMVGKFILDSVLHWIQDYKIDGIRFDLMELIDINTMKQIVSTSLAYEPSLLIYGEPWKGGDSPLTNGTYRGSQKHQEFAIFNDLFRNAIRGNNNPGNGFVNGEPHNQLIAKNIVEGLQGSINQLTAKPRESINYVDAHDNYTLWDHIEKSQNPTVTNFRQNIPLDSCENTLVRQNLLALGIIYTAQGIPFMQGGAEFLRSKNGDHNSYKSNDQINAFQWQNKLRFYPVFNYVKGLITLRKNHSAFRMADRDSINKFLTITMAHANEKSGVIIAHYHDNANNDSWKDIVVIYNATTIDAYEVNNLLPIPDSGYWQIVVNHHLAGIDTLEKVAIGAVPPLRSHSLLVIHS